MPEKAPTKECRICKTAEYVTVHGAYVGYFAYCSGCYDCDCVGDPPQYVSLGPIYHGKTEADALQQWNDNAEA